MDARQEEYTLAHRLSGYADALVAFSIVNAFAFLIAFAEQDVRCTLVQSRSLVLTSVTALQVAYVLALLGLGAVERRLRTASGVEPSDLVRRTRRRIAMARLVFVAIGGIVQVLVCGYALAGLECGPDRGAARTGPSRAARHGPPLHELRSAVETIDRTLQEKAPMIHTPPEFIDLTPEMKKRLDRFREAHKDDPIGNVGTRILLEDDRVRIWEMVLEPGEASDLHRHDHDYYLAIFEGDYVAGVMPEGSPVGSFVGKVPAQGNTVAIPKGGVEWAYNVGDKTYREILIELKDT